MSEQNYLENILHNPTQGVDDVALQEEITLKEVAETHRDATTAVKEQDKCEMAPTEKSTKSFGGFKNIYSIFLVSLLCGIIFGGASYLSLRLINSIAPIKTPPTTVVQNIDVELGAAQLVEAPKGDVLTTSISTVAQNAMPSVVSITNLSVQQVDSFFFGTQSYEYKSTGSGIIIGQKDDELLIVTNNHVIEGNKSLTVTFCDETSVNAVVKGSSASVDIAVLAIKLGEIGEDTIKTIKVATLGDSSKLIVGEPAIAIGNALGYGQSVTSGIVSAVNRKIDGFDTELIQTDASINPGNSGGALLNIRGEVIGINTAKINADAVEGMGYAIPISEINDLIQEMSNKITREKVPEEERGTLGVMCVDVNDTAAQYYNMPKGAYLNEITEGGAAEAAGISKGSIVVTFDGTSITSSTALKDLLAYYKIGEEVEVEVAVPNAKGEYEQQTFKVILK